MGLLGIIGGIIGVLFFLVIIVYAIGLVRRSWAAIKSGAEMDTKKQLSIKDNLYEGSIGMFK